MLSKQKAALVFVFITVLLDMLALGIIVPVLPKLILNFQGGRFASAAIIGGVFGTVWAVLQFVVSPILGVLSDRVGRRPVILLSNLGTSLDYVVMALAPTIWWLFLGRVISGITTSSIAVASAYVSDVTPAERRAGAYGMISACFGIGFVVGPAVGGFLGNIDPRLPFWVAAALSMVNFLYGLFVLPESLPHSLRSPFTWRRANPIGALGLLRRHHELFGLSIVNLIGYVAHEALPTIFVFYTIYRYAWDERTIGLSLALVGIITIIISAAVIQPVVSRIGERRALAAGLLSGATGFVLFGPSQLLFWIGLPVSCLWMLASSSAQAIMTRRVLPTEQGELQGAIGMLRSVGMLVGPGLFSGVFAYSVSSRHVWKLPSAAWFLGAILLGTAALVAWIVTASSDEVPRTIDLSASLKDVRPADEPSGG
ncbi:MAG TPA: TCR/Tet family MFS transporter [Candidatus Eremiobacteraceae bacterium]|nr:TCR/Tet family MFS transporter [Candidatus Eremiobacteraceae bacterium]